jgi:hypothetical protein
MLPTETGHAAVLWKSMDANMHILHRISAKHLRLLAPEAPRGVTIVLWKRVAIVAAIGIVILTMCGNCQTLIMNHEASLYAGMRVVIL